MERKKNRSKFTNEPVPLLKVEKLDGQLMLYVIVKADKICNQEIMIEERPMMRDALVSVTCSSDFIVFFSSTKETRKRRNATPERPRIPIQSGLPPSQGMHSSAYKTN